MFAICVEIPYSKYFYSLVFIYWFCSSKFFPLPSVEEKERETKEARGYGAERITGLSIFRCKRERGGHSSTEVAFPTMVSLSAAPKQLWAVGLERKNWDSGYKGGNTETAQWLVGLGKSVGLQEWLACPSGPPARRLWQGCRGQWPGS